MFDWFNKKRKAREKSIEELQRSQKNLIEAADAVRGICETQSDAIKQQTKYLLYYRHESSLLLEIVWALYDISMELNKHLFKDPGQYKSKQIEKIHRELDYMWNEYRTLNKSLVKGMKEGKYEKIQKIQITKQRSI